VSRSARRSGHDRTNETQARRGRGHGRALTGDFGIDFGAHGAHGAHGARIARLAGSGDIRDVATTLSFYRELHALLRWDCKTEVQAINLSMDVVGRVGGACRPPRAGLPADVTARIVKDTEGVLATGYT